MRGRDKKLSSSAETDILSTEVNACPAKLHKTPTSHSTRSLRSRFSSNSRLIQSELFQTLSSLKDEAHKKRNEEIESLTTILGSFRAYQGGLLHRFQVLLSDQAHQISRASKLKEIGKSRIRALNKSS